MALFSAKKCQNNVPSWQHCRLVSHPSAGRYNIVVYDSRDLKPFLHSIDCLTQWRKTHQYSDHYFWVAWQQTEVFTLNQFVSCFFSTWGRAWVHHLSLSSGHRRMPFRRWPTQFHSIYIYSVYIYILFISKRVWGHYGELISVKIQ